ncbi:MAG TPA: NUDIX domain-containing protein [Bacteroidota bacterium]|nr:NUDIX domain-containing protein [Bacteroidota bacterium]
MTAIECSIVEVCIFGFSDAGPMYLLLRRSKTDKVYPDTWQMVSGSVEGNETLVKASLRELREETGFIPERFWVVPHMNTFLNARRDVVHISAVFAGQVPAGYLPTLSSEHYAYEWCTLERARELIVWPGQIQALNIVHEYIVKGKLASFLTEIPKDQW